MKIFKTHAGIQYSVVPKKIFEIQKLLEFSQNFNRERESLINY